MRYVAIGVVGVFVVAASALAAPPGHRPDPRLNDDLEPSTPRPPKPQPPPEDAGDPTKLSELKPISSKPFVDRTTAHFHIQPRRLGKYFVSGAKTDAAAPSSDPRDRARDSYAQRRGRMAAPTGDVPADVPCDISLHALCDGADVWQGYASDCVTAGTSRDRCVAKRIGELFGEKRYIDKPLKSRASTCVHNALALALCGIADPEDGPPTSCDSKTGKSVSAVADKLVDAIVDSTAEATDKGLQGVCRDYLKSLPFEKIQQEESDDSGGGGGGGTSSPAPDTGPTPTRRCWDACSKEKQACRDGWRACGDQERACKNKC